MWDLILNKKNIIAIIGPYPPPYGGISVHIKRVLSLLETSEYTFFNETGSNYCGPHVDFYWIKRYFKALRFFILPYKLIHHHSPDKYMRLLLCFVGLFNKRVYLHIHGTSLKDSLKKKGIVPFLLRRMLRNVHILASNKEICKLAKRYNPRSINEIDAFLPPTFNIDTYNEFVDCLELRKNNIVITTVGWFTIYNNVGALLHIIALI